MRNIKWIIWFAVLLHLIQGSALIYDPSAGNTTSTHALVQYVSSNYFAGGIMVVVATMAAIELIWFQKSYKLNYLILLLPQQLILFLATGGAIKAMWLSQFADGVVRDRAFIIADQSSIVLAAVFHTAAIIEIYAPEVFNWNFLRKT
jgi:hypothetical protein